MGTFWMLAVHLTHPLHPTSKEHEERILWDMFFVFTSLLFTLNAKMRPHGHIFMFDTHPLPKTHRMSPKGPILCVLTLPLPWTRRTRPYGCVLHVQPLVPSPWTPESAHLGTFWVFSCFTLLPPSPSFLHFFYFLFFHISLCFFI